MRYKWMAGAIATVATLLLLPAAGSSALAPFNHPGRHPGGHPTPGSAVVDVETGPTGRSWWSVGPVPGTSLPAQGRRRATSSLPGMLLYYATIDPPTYGVVVVPPVRTGLRHHGCRQ